MNQRINVAANPHAPAGALTMLAGDDRRDVREVVASNPNTPILTVAALTSDADTDVRNAAALNSSIG